MVGTLNWTSWIVYQSIQTFNCIYVVEYYFTAGGKGRACREEESWWLEISSGERANLIC